MATEIPRMLQEVAYHRWAQRYLRSLRMEDFMEGVSPATQRKITVESMDVVHVHRPDIQTFNELLIQGPRKGRGRPVQVVADNMVVVHDRPIVAEGSFDVPLQPAGPFWVMEYVSKNNQRKDQEVSFPKYEIDLKVPYLAMFTPDDRELVLHRHNGTRYVTVPPNDQGRYPLPELELEIGLLDEWMRFWFRGELVPLTPDLQRALVDARRLLEEEKRRADDEKRRADDEQRRADKAEQHARELEEELRQLRARLASPSEPPGAPSS